MEEPRAILITAPVDQEECGLAPATQERSSGKGTFLSSAFTAFNSAVGTGILTLPFSFRVAGAGLGAAALIFFAVLMGIINCILAKCSEVSGTPNYQSLVKHFLGHRASVFMSVIIAVYCFFATVGGLIIVGDVTHPILTHFANDSAWWAQRPFAISVGAVLALPIMYLRDITSLRFTAMLSFAAIMYVVIVIVWIGAGQTHAEMEQRGPVKYVEATWKAFLAVPNIFLSFQCQIQVPSIYAELRPDLKSARTMMGVVALSHTVILVFYLAVAAFGYYTFRGKTPTNIMEADYNQSSSAILLARVCLAVTAVCSLPINHFPARSAIQELWGLFRGRPQEVTKGFVLVETGIFFALMLVMGLTIPNLDVLNNILGTTAGVAVIFFLPGLLILSRSRPAAVAILVVGAIAFVVSAGDFVASTFFGVH